MKTPRFRASGIGLALLILGTFGYIRANAESIVITGTFRMGAESNIIYSLQPMTMKPLGSGTALFYPEYYLDPVQVQKVAPNLVVNEGGQLVVRGDEINLMLLNEFLQARRLQRRHQQIIGELTNEVQALRAELDALKADINDLKNRQDSAGSTTQTVPSN